MNAQQALDTYSFSNIAEQLPELERDALYQAGYADGRENRRGGAALDRYQGLYPLAASDTYWHGYTQGREAAAALRQQRQAAAVKAPR